MDGVHSEEECGEEGQATVVKHTTLAGVHEQGRHGAVETHIHHVEVEWVHAPQHNIQPAHKDTHRQTDSQSARQTDRQTVRESCTD